MKVLFTYNFYCFVLNLISNSSSVMSVLITHIEQICLKSGVEISSTGNVAQDVYRCVICISSCIITGEDLDEVTCPTCGRFPTITFSDGNVKNATNQENKGCHH